MFAIGLIVIIIINTRAAIDESYTKQDMRYDLNYLLYSGGFFNSKGGDPDSLLSFLRYYGEPDMNLLVTNPENKKIVFKSPGSKHFFEFPDSILLKKESVIDNDPYPHPYYSLTDYYSLLDTLGYLKKPLMNFPYNINVISSGDWVGWSGEVYSADMIENSRGDRYFIVSNTPLDLGSNILTQGFIIGALAILCFVSLVYYYIRIRLRPIRLMKKRIDDLDRGDLSSKIKIMGTDELAELSISFNRLISEIGDLVNQKHKLLLDVSHELKSPLARMLLLVEMLPEGKQSTALQEEIAFLNDMISNLLLIDKLDTPYSTLDLKEISFKNLFEKIIHFFNQDQKNKIHFINDSKNPICLIDLTKMIVCVKNIIQNSFKYADTKKGVVITLKCMSNSYEIHIRDFGLGVDEKNKEKIFDPFFRSSKVQSVSGFGLGLSISKKIIESHGGTLGLIPNMNPGAAFILTFPLGGKMNDKQTKH